MAKLIASKTKPLHQKRKKSSAVRLNDGTIVKNKSQLSSTIDVTRKSQIVVVKGNHAVQQAALIALRSELAELTENYSFTVGNSKKDEPKASKHFIIRWITKE